MLASRVYFVRSDGAAGATGGAGAGRGPPANASISPTGSRGSGESGDEGPGVDTQNRREGEGVEEPDVALAAFDGPHIGAVEAGPVPEFLLRDPETDPRGTDASSELGTEIGIVGHLPNVAA